MAHHDNDVTPEPKNHTNSWDATRVRELDLRPAPDSSGGAHPARSLSITLPIIRSCTNTHGRWQFNARLRYRHSVRSARYCVVVPGPDMYPTIPERTI